MARLMDESWAQRTQFERPCNPQLQMSKPHNGKMQNQRTCLKAAPKNDKPKQRRASSGRTDTSQPVSEHLEQDILHPNFSHNSSHTKSSDSFVSKAKLNPILRKFSSNDRMPTIDLSRSAAENKALEMYHSSESAIPGRKPSFPGALDMHSRNPSGNSHLSLNSGTHWASGPYNYQNHHFSNSVSSPSLGSDLLETTGVDPAIFDYEDATVAHSRSNPPTPIDLLQGAKSDTNAYGIFRHARTPTSLNIRSTSSRASLRGDASITTPETSSSLRFPVTQYLRGNEANSSGLSSSYHSPSGSLVSPTVMNTARSSMDSQRQTRFRLRATRSRSNTVQTAASKASNTSNGDTDQDNQAQMATSVAILRQKFQEKEAAKDARIKAAEARAQEKEQRRLDRKSSLPGITSRSTTSQSLSRPEDLTMQTESHPFSATPYETHEMDSIPPAHVPIATLPRTGSIVDRRRVKTSWAMFWYRFKSMILNIKRSIHSSRSSRLQDKSA